MLYWGFRRDTSRSDARCGKRFLQLPGIHWYAIRGRILLKAPSFRERAGIHDIEPELVKEIGDHLLCGSIISGDRMRPPVRRAGRAAVALDVGRLDRVKDLDDLRFGQVAGQKFARRDLVPIQLADMAVPLRVIVVGVEDDLSFQHPECDRRCTTISDQRPVDLR